MNHLSISYTPITNAEYALFLKATRHQPPATWVNGRIPSGKSEMPVTNVSIPDVLAYCEWRTAQDGSARYRLPTEREWMTAAGTLPSKARINCGESLGMTSVRRFATTRAACGAIDMWGNCWEWTATRLPGKPSVCAVKGGAWNTPRAHCRTETSSRFGRTATNRYPDVTFRIVREQY